MPHWETQRRIDGWGLLGLFFSDALCMFQEDILGWNTWDFLWRFSWFVSFLLIHGFWYKWSQKHLSRVSHMVFLYVHVSLVRQSITACDPLGTKYSCVLGSWTSLFMTFVNQESLSLFPLFSLPTSSCLDQEEKICIGGLNLFYYHYYFFMLRFRFFHNELASCQPDRKTEK